MGRVDEISRLTGNRYLVSLDDGRKFPLYKNELSKYGLSEGEDVPEDTAEEIMTALLPKRARTYALHLLEQSDRTEYQLRKKLQDKSYPPEVTEDAVEYVKSYHYIDDLRYAENFIESRLGSESIRLMMQELYVRGISKETARQAAENVAERSGIPDEEGQIRDLLKKKHYDPSSDDRREQQRMYDFLIRKGYGQQEISHVLRFK